MRREESLFKDKKKEQSSTSARIKLSQKSKQPYFNDGFRSDKLGGYSRFKDDKEKDSSPQRKITIYILILTIIAALFFWFKTGAANIWDNFFKPYSFEIINSLKSPKPKLKSKKDALRSIKDLIQDSSGNYAVFVYSFDKDEAYGLNEDEVYFAASINKVPIMLSFYREIERGSYSGDEEYELSEEDIQDYGTGSMRYEEPGKKYTYKKLLSLSGKKSDNTAVYVLTNLLGASNVQRFIQVLGLTSTSIEKK